MTDKHDFKAALEEFEGVPIGIPDHRFGDMWIDGDTNQKTYKAIQAALTALDNIEALLDGMKVEATICCDAYNQALEDVKERLGV